MTLQSLYKVKLELLGPNQIKEKIIMEANKKMLGNSLNRSTKCKQHITKPIAFYNEITSSVDEDAAVNANNMYFCNAFDSLP